MWKVEYLYFEEIYKFAHSHKVLKWNKLKNIRKENRTTGTTKVTSEHLSLINPSQFPSDL